MKVRGKNIKKSGLQLTGKIKREFEKATKLYKDFHWGKNVNKITKLKAPEVPKVVAILGYLRGVTYQTTKKGDERDVFYIHAFEKPFPILATDPEGKHLFILEGGFKVKEEGIVG